MGKWEAIAVCVAVVAIFGSFAIGGAIKEYKGADVRLSCNNLKAAAIAASAPVPECAK